MRVRPGGTVTFLFTDIEGSTRLWERLPDTMREALETHDRIVRGAIEAHGGQVFATGGDGFAAVFGRAGDALDAARAAQDGLASQAWPADARVRVRMGLHTGEASERDGDYFGPAVNTAARLMGIGHGGQVLCSAATAGVVDELGVARDLGDHHVRDVAQPIHVFQVGNGEFPPLRSVGSDPTNLPLMVADLVGRDDDLGALAGLVDTHRLVTLAGPGGIGKTRLAVEAARAASAAFPDGVWFVDLAPVTEDDDVIRAMATALGAPTATASEAALAGYVKPRRLLAVFDNCEHVIDGAAALAEQLLAAAPEVHMLATSRELLDVPGEHVQWVAPLAPAEAIRLFEERARAVRPEFRVDDANTEAVAEICHRLDGVPLALEWAAARVTSMSPADIRDRLGERFRLLAGGRRRQDRHRTLLAAVGWSYDLLEPEAQRLFRALSVFMGSFDLAAATAVAGGGDEFAVADEIRHLVARSLVGYDPATGRYRLLETLRQYGADRLVEAGESDATRERFAAHFGSLAQRDGPLMTGDGVVAAQERLEPEIDNFNTLVDLYTEIGRLDLVVALTRDLWQLLIEVAPGDGRAWIDPIVDGDLIDDPQLRYDSLWTGSSLAIVVGDIDRALALDARREEAAGDEIVESPWSMHAQILVETTTGNVAALRPLCARMKALAAAHGDHYADHFARSIELLTFDRDDSEFESALASLIRSAEEVDSALWIAVTLSCGVGPFLRGNYDELDLGRVVDLYEARPGWRQAGDFLRSVIASTLCLGLTRRDPDAGIAVAIDGFHEADRIGGEFQRVACLQVMALATAMTGRTQVAATIFSEAQSSEVAPFIAHNNQVAHTEALLLSQGLDPNTTTGDPLTRRDFLDLITALEADVLSHSPSPTTD